MSEGCWKQIGVFGDASCPELVRHVHCRNCPTFVAAGRELLERAPPPGYREEWTALLSRDKPARRLDVSVVVFRVGGEWFALDTRLFVEVASWRRPHRIAHRGGALAGLVNIRGQLHLCLHLNHVLQLEAPPATPPPTARILVIALDDVMWAVIADEVQGVQAFARDTVRTPPRTTGDGGHLRGVTSWNGFDVGVLDSEALFSALAGAVGQ